MPTTDPAPGIQVPAVAALAELSLSTAGIPKPLLRLRGRSAEPPVESGSVSSALERARAAQRLDPRRPAAARLKLVSAEPVVGDPARAVAARLAREIGAERFRHVFADPVGFVVHEGVLRIEAPTRAAAGLIERRFGPAVADAACAVLGPGATVQFAVVEHCSTPPTGARVDHAAPKQTVRAGSARTPNQARPRAFRLEELVVGESNRLAINAATQIADAELDLETEAGATARVGGAPLFLHGPCGVGKTHLLQGLAHRFRERHPGAVVRVVSGETFLNEFISAIRHGGGGNMTGHSRSTHGGGGGIERFRRQYRRCDLLCIDDVHFLVSKQATQQELLHTFDQIVQSARIVLACDQHPRQLKLGEGGFSPALVSRFLSGMVAGIEPPDAPLREQAARMFAQRRGLVLEQAALSLLVEQTSPVPGQPATSIRDIEGLITRVDAVHRVEGSGNDSGPASIGVMTVARALGATGGLGAGVSAIGARVTALKPIRSEHIIAQTCMALGVERPELAASTRHKRVVLARAMITHLCRELTTMSFPEIARAIGRPNHSTVITAHQRLARQIQAGEVYGIGPSGEAMTVGGLARHLISALTRGGMVSSTNTKATTA